MSGLDRARAVLDNLLEEYGELTPAMVVEAARPEESPIHDQFEWDDSVAAEHHRRDQARRLIRRVKVVYGVDEEGREKKVRAFVSARQEPRGPRAYRPTEEVLQNPVARQLLLREFEREWLIFRARYEHLAEFWQVIRPDGESQAG